MIPFPFVPPRMTSVSIIPMSKSVYMRRTPDAFYSFKEWHDLSLSRKLFLNKYFTAKRYALLGRLEKAGMKNIRIKM